MRSYSIIKFSFFAFVFATSMNTSAQVGGGVNPGNTAEAFEVGFINTLTDGHNLQVNNSNVSLRKAAFFETEKVNLVNTESHVEIVPEYSSSGLKLKLRYDSMALSNPEMAMKDIIVYMVLSSYKDGFLYSKLLSGNLPYTLIGELDSPHIVAELITNARMGSPTARARWGKIQESILSAIKLNASLIEKFNLRPDIVEYSRTKLSTQVLQWTEEAKIYAKKQQKALDRWKTDTGILDKYEAMNEKLNDLILKNDRKGVRQLLEAYLPWAVMEPVETQSWKLWLEAIEFPDKNNSLIAFRGLKYDTDKIQRKLVGNSEVFGFMSTVLTKNQGNYTRRLRSLSTNREKIGDKGYKPNGEQVLSVKITDQMTSHSRSPVASNFLSFTFSPSVANSFVGENKVKFVDGKNVSTPYGGLLAIKIDARRIVPNIVSMYGGEVELLVPLIIFPDEVLLYNEGSFTQEFTFKNYLEKIKEKTGIDYTLWTEVVDANNMNLKSQYSSRGYLFLGQIMNLDSRVKRCESVFAN